MYLHLKRFFDIAFSIFGLIILSPLILLTALLIKLESKGPALFLQNRIGRKGKWFKIYKFRSMTVGAEKAGVYTTKDDVRVTKVGKIIRATSIDELPQFINILKGEMSVIGPRPVLNYHLWPFEDYSSEQKKRFSVSPGVTGWAQINGRKDVPWELRIEQDIKNVNLISF